MQQARSSLTLWEAEEQAATALHLPFAIVRGLVLTGKLSAHEAASVYDALVTEFPPERRERARELARAELSRIH